MSLNFKKDHIFGEPISPGSITQLNRRKEILTKRTERSSDDVHYLTSNTAWVRVTSSVDVTNDSGPKNAKKYQLFKGIYSADRGFVPEVDPDRSSYTQSSEYGYVPIAGITDFEVLTQSKLGTLRVGKIGFIVNSPEDFSILEQLYLRPGYTLLLEWGHSVKVNNDGSVDSNISYFDLDNFLTELSLQEIKDRILALRERNSYNYDGMLGLIRNFSWEYNGTNYICNVEVVSNGEILESILNNNPSAGNSNDENEDTSYDSNTFSSDLQKILHLIKTAPIDSFFDNANSSNTISSATDKVKSILKKAIPTYSDTFNDLRIIAAELAGDGISRESFFTKYIRLRDFLNFINVDSLLYDKDQNNIIKFYAGDEAYPFTTFSDHIGLDPGICVLTKKSKNSKFHIPLSIQNSDLDENDLLNIFISVDFLLSKVVEFRKSEDDTDNNIFSIVESILLGLTNNLGNINDFYIALDDDTNTFHIVDTTVTPSNIDYEIGDDGNPKAYVDLVGLKSEVENLQIQSNLTSKFSTIISIAAQQASDPAALENISSLQRWNQGLVNRHLPEVNTGTTKTEDSKALSAIDEKVQQYVDFLADCSKSNLFYLIYDQDKFNGYYNIHRYITRETLHKTTELSGTNSPGLIPLTLSFTIKGISGIKPMQSFKINEFFLPERYKGRIGFIIKKLDHKIVNSRWVTEIEAYIKPL